LASRQALFLYLTEAGSTSKLLKELLCGDTTVSRIDRDETAKNCSVSSNFHNTPSIDKASLRPLKKHQARLSGIFTLHSKGMAERTCMFAVIFVVHIPVRISSFPSSTQTEWS
jgi:hypothetical protein